jgi:hypothetical protein
MTAPGVPSQQPFVPPGAPGSSGPQDWNKRFFRNKNPADENGVDNREGNGIVDM